ncbi:MAG: lipase maturation factor family protein [Gammaproteobacteria bacterium]|nr:lipase maturation factor family protein [Gammaproteobacteria bacterium]MBL7000728.1 lipase maturation factor family protein [Gammaproteobacteria bacterium]
MFSFSSQFSDGENSYRLIAALFLRLLAIIYFMAFFSLSFQITGLVGEQGILPLSPWLDSLLSEMGGSAFVYFPMLFWFEQSDFFLQAVAWSGCVVSISLLLNIWPRLSLILLFIFYLSLVKAGQTFMNFQWDGLLLEAGFLAIFLRPDSRILILLFRWLLFRLRFMSGISKLVMGDPSWLGMTALIYYFETQPLPHVGAWYFDNLPQILLIAATVLVLIIEIIVPFMMFLPRRYRLIAAWATLALQVLIMLSSNHNWFNFLTIALCLFLFDDKAVRRIVPGGLERWLTMSWAQRLQNPRARRSVAASYLLAGVVTLGGILSIHKLVTNRSLGTVADTLQDILQQWHIVNTYHVFPTMTTRQIELKIEGSIDGINWKEYEFIHRPNALSKAPTIVFPHHPRLDWMMWFVPFHPRFLPWFDAFLQTLLENSAQVTALLKDNPFKDQAPRYLRVNAWHYEFTSPAEREQTGNWWKRSYLGPFYPLPGKYRIAP